SASNGEPQSQHWHQLVVQGDLRSQLTRSIEQDEYRSVDKHNTNKSSRDSILRVAKCFHTQSAVVARQDAKKRFCDSSTTKWIIIRMLECEAIEALNKDTTRNAPAPVNASLLREILDLARRRLSSQMLRNRKTVKRASL